MFRTRHYKYSGHSDIYTFNTHMKAHKSDKKLLVFIRSFFPGIRHLASLDSFRCLQKVLLFLFVFFPHTVQNFGYLKRFFCWETVNMKLEPVQAAQHYGYGVNAGHYPNPRDPMGYGGYYQQCAMSPHQQAGPGHSPTQLTSPAF
jgi:hypothetical protein